MTQNQVIGEEVKVRRVNLVQYKRNCWNKHTLARFADAAARPPAKLRAVTTFGLAAQSVMPIHFRMAAMISASR